ncbi:MAG: NUDIX hydrolase [Pirellulales bacterium]|nr:NUDIX hydrolase [Pirellulales bacterium]
MSSTSQPPIAQAMAVPYRPGNEGPEFCLITSLGRGDWIFPKGIIDPGENAVETALKEAREEAGLEGRIEGEPLGQYAYKKWGTSLEVTALLMRVTSVEDVWDESDLRRRVWHPAPSAQTALERPILRELLDAAVQRLEAT